MSGSVGQCGFDCRSHCGEKSQFWARFWFLTRSDSGLTFDTDDDTLASSLFSTLFKINRVWYLFDNSVPLIILKSLVFSKLFYCSTVWSGATKQNIKNLQLVQNFAARIRTGLRKYYHISQTLNDLGWLPVKDVFIHRDLIMMYKCLNGFVASYISRNIAKRSQIHGVPLGSPMIIPWASIERPWPNVPFSIAPLEWVEPSDKRLSVILVQEAHENPLVFMIYVIISHCIVPFVTLFWQMPSWFISLSALL